MPKAVLWDVGNVMVRWDPRTLYSRIFPEPAERDWFLSHVCTMAWHVRHDLGVTFEENRRPLLEQFPEHEAAIRAWETGWWDMFSGHIPETARAMEALADRGVPQFVLSNMSHEVIDGIAALAPAWDRLQGVAISAEWGLMKPDPAIFHRTCGKFGLIPAETLFIDDSAANIAAARDLGFDTHHFTDPAGLAPALAARGLA